MNKSKFLRKSLALLLSVLMVVAMIPVGASAADTTTALSAITVNGETVSVVNNTANVSVTEKTFNILVNELKATETAVLTKKDETTVQVGGTGVSAAVSVNAADYTANGNVYTLPLTLINGSATAEYKILVTVEPKSTSVELESVTGTLPNSGAAAKPYSVFSAGVSGRTINVTVPQGYSNQATLVVKTKDNATISNATGATLDDTAAPAYELKNVTDGATFKVTSQFGNVASYTVKMNKVAALSSITIGGVEGKFSDENNDDVMDTITFTYPASVLENDVTIGKLPASDFEVKFTTRSDSTVATDAEGTSSAVASGDKLNFTNSNAFVTGKKVTITCKGITSSYDLVLTTVESSDCTITSATVDGEKATVAGTKITADLAKTKSGPVAVKLVANAKATIKSGSVNFTAGAADGEGMATFTASTLTVDQLKKGIVLTVTAQDGSTKQYELKVTATGTVNTAYLTSFALRIGAETYEGKVTGASEYTVTVPYLTTDDDLENAAVIATTNPYVGVYADANATTPVVKGDDINLDVFALTANKKSGSDEGVIYAISKNDKETKHEYKVIVKLETAKAGNTLNNVALSSATSYKTLDSSNVFDASVKTDAAKKTGTIEVRPSYSAAKARKALYVKSIATNQSGVAYVKASTSSYEKLGGDYEYDNYNITVTPSQSVATAAKSTNAATIVVVNEVDARAIDNGENPTTLSSAVTYTVVVDPNAASKEASLTNIVFDETIIGRSLSGSVPYGVTASGDADTASAMFVDFTVSANATLKVSDGTTEYALFANGDSNGDGKADAVSNSNAKLMLVRNTGNKTVTLKVYDGTNVKEVKSVLVYAEDGDTMNPYAVNEITYATPNSEAKITAFSIAGVAGSITAEGDNNWSVTVNAPLGTDLTSQIPTFTASAGATVELNGKKIKSGETTVDFSSNVVLTVTSEDSFEANTYTVKASVSESFSDIKTTDWFYNNVMAAYKAGYCSGNPDGTFAPNNDITRRDVAIMVYKMMGSPAVTSTASFADVAADDYAASAIAFLKESDIVSGDAETGKFRPGDRITRQEVASILAKAKKLSGTTDNLFNDDAKISDWAKPAVYACRVAGVFNGDNNGNFNAQANITRAEVATAVLQAASK